MRTSPVALCAAVTIASVPRAALAQLGGAGNGMDQAAALMAQAGFKPVEERTLFTGKWFIIYGKQ